MTIPTNPLDITQEITRLHAEFCSALADARRLLLLYALADGPKNVSYQLADRRVIDALDLLRAVMREQISQRAELLGSAAEGG